MSAKFSRYLEDSQTPEWKRAYLDYRELKKTLEKIHKEQHGAGYTSDEHSDNEAEPHRVPISPGLARSGFPKGPRFDAASFEAPRTSSDSRGPFRSERRGSAIVSYARSLTSMKTSSKRYSAKPPARQSLQELLSRLTPAESSFFSTLDAQLDKVEKFYRERETELQMRARLINMQLEELSDHKKFIQATYPKPGTWSSSILSGIRYKLKHAMRSDNASISSKIISPPKNLAAVKPIQVDFDPEGQRSGRKHRSGSQEGSDSSSSEREKKLRSGPSFSADPDDYLYAKKKLKQAVLEHYRGLEMLRNFRVLNLTGFKKALRKFEKATNFPVTEIYMFERVDKSALASEKSIRLLMEEMERVYTVQFADNDRRRARERLKSGSLARTHYTVSLWTGAFLGLSVAAVISGIWSSYQDSTHRVIGTALRPLLLLYSVFAIPIILSVLVGLNLLVWSKWRINYTFIFGLDDRTRLNFHEYFIVPCVLLVTLSFAFWLSLFHVGSGSVSPTSWPLVWLGFTIILVFNPFPYSFRSARYWFLRNMGRLFASGFIPVEFADFWLADQFCSLVFPLSNLGFFVCVYATNFQDGDWERCNLTGHYWPFAPIIGSFGQITRLLQSIKRYTSCGNTAHLINAGKYFWSIATALMFFYWRHLESPRSGHVFVLWIMCNSISTLYSSGWDYWMDWSLLRPRAKYPFLRDELIYSDYVPMYHIALITNTVIRFTWLYFIPSRGPDMFLRSSIIGLLEVFRRWQWNFIRVENEHLGNVDQYRVTREVPLPYTLSSTDDYDADEQEMRTLRQSMLSGAAQQRYWDDVVLDIRRYEDDRTS